MDIVTVIRIHLQLHLVRVLTEFHCGVPPGLIFVFFPRARIIRVRHNRVRRVNILTIRRVQWQRVRMLMGHIPMPHKRPRRMAPQPQGIIHMRRR